VGFSSEEERGDEKDVDKTYFTTVSNRANEKLVESSSKNTYRFIFANGGTENDTYNASTQHSSTTSSASTMQKMQTDEDDDEFKMVRFDGADFNPISNLPKFIPCVIKTTNHGTYRQKWLVTMGKFIDQSLKKHLLDFQDVTNVPALVLDDEVTYASSFLYYYTDPYDNKQIKVDVIDEDLQMKWEKSKRIEKIEFRKKGAGELAVFTRNPQTGFTGDAEALAIPASSNLLLTLLRKSSDRYQFNGGVLNLWE
jgi:hypothetical protein